jgi:phosphoglycolate phosphatase
LEALKDQGSRLMLATSKPAVFARRIVGHFGMQRWLDGVYGSELDGRMADKVELLAHIIECEGLVPDNCIMVGDREHDVRAARYHGMEAVGVLWGYGTPVELLEAGAGTLVSSPGELLEVLLSSGR